MSKARVLVVDDDADLRATVVEILESHGYAVAAARSGEEALCLVAVDPPDVILLDVLMAGSGGEAFAAAYRRLPGARAALVVFSALPDAGERAAALGAAAVLPKPFHVRELVDLVARVGRGT